MSRAEPAPVEDSRGHTDGVATANVGRDGSVENGADVENRERIEKDGSVEDGDRDVLLRWQEARGHLAIVIDDVGRDLGAFECLFELPYPLTFAVLPRSRYAETIQARIVGRSARPREVFVHLPLEPFDAARMAEGEEVHEVFLLLKDSPAMRRAKLEDALSRVPAASGVNNHMGSRFTTDAHALREVMDVLATRDLLFLDSRTIATSAAEAVARSTGLLTGSRQVFLDHEPTQEAIERQFDDAIRRSFEEPVIAIAHPSPVLIDVLRRRLPLLRDERVGVYPASRVMRAQSER